MTYLTGSHVILVGKMGKHEEIRGSLLVGAEGSLVFIRDNLEAEPGQVVREEWHLGKIDDIKKNPEAK